MAIPKPDPRDWLSANARELALTDREVLAMLRATKKRVDAILKELPKDSNLIRRAQLENTRARLLAEQAEVFTRLGDIVSARRASAASRSARLSAAADAALLSLVGKSTQGQYLYDSALQVSQRAIDAALQRMKFSALPLSQRIYNTNVWMNGRLGKLINETLASGLNAQEFARRARDWFNPNTPGGVRYAALRLARTEINNAFHSMSAQKYAETPWIDEVDWNLSKSHPKPDDCDAYAKAGPYPSDMVPPRPHPQCMCYITPKSVDEDDFVENFLKGEYDDYIDGKLAEKGWFEPEAEPAREKAAAESLATAPAPLRGDAAMDSVPKGLFKRGSVTPEQRKALQVYESGWFSVINGFLRRGDRWGDANYDKEERDVRRIDSAMQESVLPSDIQVWRGMFNAKTVFGDRIDGNLEGFSWHEKGYGSTTTEESVTDRFNTMKSPDDRLKDAYRKHKGSASSMVSIADLRDDLSDLTSYEFNQLLLRMDREQVIQLESDPLRSRLTDRQRAAAVPLGGEDMHLVYIRPEKLNERSTYNVKLEVVVAAGTQAVQLSTKDKGSKANGGQAEITLQRDTQWTVVKDDGHDESGVRRIQVAVSPVSKPNVAGTTDSGAAGGQRVTDSRGADQPEPVRSRQPVVKATPSGNTRPKSTRPEDQLEYYIPRWKNAETRPAYTIQNALLDGKTPEEAIAAASQKFGISESEAIGVYNEVLKRYGVPNHVADRKAGGTTPTAVKPQASAVQRAPVRPQPQPVRRSHRQGEIAVDEGLQRDMEARISRGGMRRDVEDSIRRVVRHQQTFVGERVKRVTEFSQGNLDDNPTGGPGANKKFSAIANPFNGKIQFSTNFREGTKIRQQQSGAVCNHDHEHDIDGTVAHEMGHVLLSSWDLNAEEQKKLVNGLAKAFGLPFIPQAPAKGVYGIIGLNELTNDPRNKAIIQRSVSRYAGSNINEMIAEIWMAYTMQDSPTKEILEAGALLHEFVRSRPIERKQVRRR